MKAWLGAHRKPIVAGMLGAACMAVYWFVVRLVFGLATPSELFLDRGAPFINVYLFGTFINLFGGYTHLKEIGFLSVVLGELVVGILGALLYAAIVKRRDPRIALAGFATFAVLLWIAIGAVLSPQLMTSISELPRRRPGSQICSASLSASPYTPS
ncbi:MAG: hypothetical protein M3Y18_00750 [Candidatus Eremiobacteraeota bacterium]|nr:hypothetical protein [Candidatus Eremiobacteraeota bacterium]